MAIPPYHDDAVRVPLWMLIVNGQPCVVDDFELGTKADAFRQSTAIITCLGASWARQYHPEMVELWRYHKGTDYASGLPSQSKLAVHGAPRPAQTWSGFTPQKQLGWVFPPSYAPNAEDLCTIQALASPAPELSESYYYTNGQDRYPGHPPAPPWFGSPDPTQDFRLHAPQVIQVNMSWDTRGIQLDPDTVAVSAGKGSPLIWRRGDGLPSADGGFSFALASLSIEEHVQAPAPGQTYRPQGRFIVRHQTPGEIVVIDHNAFEDGSQGQDYNYRLSVYDNTDAVASIDPKIRNTSSLGSGAPGGG